MRTLVLTAVAIACVAPLTLFGQASTQSTGSFDFSSSGIVFRTADSANAIIMRFRMQNWLTYNTVSTSDLSAASTELVVRRLRLRFGGHVFDPRLTFNLQLSFSRSDQDYSDTQFPNIVRDAMVFWNFSPRLQVGFGQTKLPGNRQRVISSGDQEIADRSIVNGAFNLDRDFGLQGFWQPIHGPVIMNLRAAISSGEGRNAPTISGGGFAYTGRVEILPMGAFLNGGDYFDSDLMREPTPKLSVGVSAQYNEDMNKTRGEVGKALYAPRTATVLYADALLKYRGLAVYGEYAQRSADDPITVNPSNANEKRAVFVGRGYMAQASYLLPFNLLIGGRYAVTEAGDQLAGLSDYARATNLAGVLTYYVNGHRIKTNLELGMRTAENLNVPDSEQSSLYGRVNLEFGI